MWRYSSGCGSNCFQCGATISISAFTFQWMKGDFLHGPAVPKDYLQVPVTGLLWIPSKLGSAQFHFPFHSWVAWNNLFNFPAFVSDRSRRQNSAKQRNSFVSPESLNSLCPEGVGWLPCYHLGAEWTVCAVYPCLLC